MRVGHRSSAVLADVAAAALGVCLLLGAAPAQATPVFTDAQTSLDPFSDANTSVDGGANDCAVTPTGGLEPSVPVVENGPAASVPTTNSATFDNTSIPADTATGTWHRDGGGEDHLGGR
jgi:hypothetical protein